MDYHRDFSTKKVGLAWRLIARNGHDYSVYTAVCARPLSNNEMKDILSRFSIPGHAGNVASDGNSTDYAGPIPGGRVNVDFADNGLSVHHTTLDPHIFAKQIDRHIYSDRFGRSCQSNVASLVRS